MLSVRPQGGFQASERYRTSDVTVSEEGVSMKARARISVMVRIKILKEKENTRVAIKEKKKGQKFIFQMFHVIK